MDRRLPRADALQGRRFTTYTEREGLVGNQVRAIYEDGDGVLWIGTYDGGLYRLKDGRLTRYTRKEGLHDNGVFQILEDDSGNFWIGLQSRHLPREPARLERRSPRARGDRSTSVVLGAKDGLASLGGQRRPSAGRNEDDRRPVLVSDDGRRGRRRSEGRSSQHQPPPVVIEEVRRAAKRWTSPPASQIPPATSSFEIRYTAPSFIEPGQVGFRYRLAGLDDDWVDARRRARRRCYHRIPPGRYRFMVIAANNDGVWNTHGAGVDIVVLPPFWRTWWFVDAGVAAIGVAGRPRPTNVASRGCAASTACRRRSRSS